MKTANRIYHTNVQQTVKDSLANPKCTSKVLVSFVRAAIPMLTPLFKNLNKIYFLFTQCEMSASKLN